MFTDQNEIKSTLVIVKKVHSPKGASGFEIDNNEVIAPWYAQLKIRKGAMASTKKSLFKI